ncbi:hypothetical protein JW823_01080 [bacterium]|nr:hypothetical protein [candidate division CSSED10-310 bacterium]
MNPHASFITISLAALIVLLVGVHFYWFYTVEDAFISFRYCDHFLAGDGLTYNPGERVEGYTNFLWIIVMIPFRLFWEFPIAAKIPGIMASLMLLILLFNMDGRRVPQSSRRLAGPLAALMVSTSPGIQMWAVAGLETILFTGCLVGAVFLHEKATRLSRFASGLIFGFASLTRPEGILFFAIFMITISLQYGYRKIHPLDYLLGYFLIVIPHQCFRLLYYKDWIPNTFWVKSHRYQGGGFAYFKRYLAMTGVLLAPVALWGVIRKSIRSEVIHLLVMTFGYLIYVYLIGGDWMPYGRFLIPAIPFVALAAARTITMTSPGFLKRLFQILLGLSIIVTTISARYDLLRMRPSRYFDILTWEASHMKDWKVVGEWLRQHANPENTLCTGLAGILPYYAGLRTLDSGGLNDSEIARIIFDSDDPLIERQRIENVILTRQPDLVMIEELSFQMLRSEPGLAGKIEPRSRQFLNHYGLISEKIDDRFFSYYKRHNPAEVPRK